MNESFVSIIFVGLKNGYLHRLKDGDMGTYDADDKCLGANYNEHYTLEYVKAAFKICGWGKKRVVDTEEYKEALKQFGVYMRKELNMLNFVVKFKTLTSREKVVMSQVEILEDEQLAKHAKNIIDGFDSGVVGLTVDTECYGKVSIEIEGYEA